MPFARKLGLNPIPRAAKTEQTPAAAPTRQTRSLVMRALGANTSKIRYEIGDTVVYRKHWFVLLQQAGLPALIILVLAGLLVRHLFVLAFDPNVSLLQRTAAGLQIDSMSLILPILMIPCFLWMLYQVIDWSNDVFEVTQDQIIDLDKTPFGTEEAARRAVGEYPGHGVSACGSAGQPVQLRDGHYHSRSGRSSPSRM